MQQITPARPWPLHDVARTRAIEQAAAAALPPHTLMQRAGLAVARLALATAPHARTIWVACGPGNNGGDGMLAAMHLLRWGKNPVVSWLGSIDHAPAEAATAYHCAVQAG
ncbi:NAD(P)H-hydrate epimerase, partial [Rhodoferax sp.]|uniref:NAD(P)H-hydrate epimerase n=1 Tax=Rhodoferax sp. TaxID=50421 RepID=UPI002772C585|nr:NAD(P)H-hydrate epimerase [Rhodoferax sp.]